MRVLGCDPGLSGGLALLSEDGLLLEPMPILPGEKRQLDDLRIVGLIGVWAPRHAVLEYPHARQGIGVVASISLGASYGVLRGILAALAIPYTEVRPQAWQKAVIGPFPKGESKVAAMRRCQQLWPGMDFGRTPACKTMDSGLCDAALLAEHGRRLLTGGRS